MTNSRSNPFRTCATLFRIALALALAPALAAPDAASALELVVRVDATDLPRKLLRSRVEFPASPGPLDVFYPKWVPGIHGPKGPVENLGGLRFRTPAGEEIPWRRDDFDTHRFRIEVPAGTDRVVAEVEYLTNQPSVNSTGVDAFGSSLLGYLNWNVALVYPEGAKVEETVVNARIRTPDGWKRATAMKEVGDEDGWAIYAPQNLRQFVDRPLIAGRHLRTIDLGAKNGPPAFLHLVSESEGALRLPDEVVAIYSRLVEQAYLMFGGAPFPEYRFLVVCSDDSPYMGLEHLDSSLNGVGERDLHDEKKRKGWAGYLLPHEFVHAWCGKYRRPAGMATPDLHTDARTDLLWVYEGLTQYLGEALSVRAGMMTQAEYLDRFAWKVGQFARSKSRAWRTLEDTAIASHILRGHSRYWGLLRGGQDYYDEGLLLWMEADATIRELTDGAKSLDDFCRAFFAFDPATDPAVKPHDLAEVVAALRATVEHPWEEFLEARVRRTHEAFPLGVVEALGYRVRYAPEPSEYFKERERERGTIHAADSIGLTFASDGTVFDVVPGGAGDRAGFAPGTKAIGVNDRKFGSDRLKDAIADSATKRSIEFLVLEGDAFRTIEIPYDGGPPYMELARDPDRPDRLGEILAPRGEGADTAPAAATE